MNNYTVIDKSGRTLLDTFNSVEAWIYFAEREYAYAIFRGVDLLEVKDGK